MAREDRWNQGNYWFVKLLTIVGAVAVGLWVGTVLAFNFFRSLF